MEYYPQLSETVSTCFLKDEVVMINHLIRMTGNLYFTVQTICLNTITSMSNQFQTTCQLQYVDHDHIHVIDMFGTVAAKSFPALLYTLCGFHECSIFMQFHSGTFGLEAWKGFFKYRISNSSLQRSSLSVTNLEGGVNGYVPSPPLY